MSDVLADVNGLRVFLQKFRVKEGHVLSHWVELLPLWGLNELSVVDLLDCKVVRGIG